MWRVELSRSCLIALRTLGASKRMHVNNSQTARERNTPAKLKGPRAQVTRRTVSTAVIAYEHQWNSIRRSFLRYEYMTLSHT
jgi:hypothetical protein